MNYLLALLLSLTCAQAASSALVGGVRRNFDTTGTNTTTSAVTITGTGGTNLNAGTVQATNSVNVGRAGEAGTIQLTSTNSTYTVLITITSNGQVTITPTTPDGTSAFVLNPDVVHTTGPIIEVKDGAGNVVFNALANSGHTGTGTNVLTDAGYYTNLQSGIWLPGQTTNVLAYLNGPFGTNLVQFNFNGGLVVGSNTIAQQGTSKFYAIQSYRDVALGDPSQTLVQLNQLNGGTGDILEWLVNMSGASMNFNRSAVNGADTASIEEIIIPTNAIFRLHNGQIEFTGTPSRIYWNSTTNTVFDTAGNGSPEGAVTASPGSTYRNFAGGATNAFWVKETGNGDTGWINK